MAKSSAVAFDWRYCVIDGLHRNEGHRPVLDLDVVLSSRDTCAGLPDIVQSTLEQISVGFFFARRLTARA